MKKLGILIMPFMVASFLLGCNGGGGGEDKVTYTMTFNGNHCKANNEDVYEEGSNVSFEITPDSYCVLPENKEGITVEGVDEYDYVVSSTGTATFSCTMTANVTVSVTAKPKPVHTLYITQANGMSLPSAIDVGKSFEIIAINKDGVKVEATFTSEDETITITNENNVVTVKGELGGSATIKCQATGYVTTMRKLEVIPLVMSIEQDDSKGKLPTSIYAGDKIYLAAYDANNTKVEGAVFSTEDKTITIAPEGDKIALTGVSEGYGKIVCKAKGYIDAEERIYVKDLKIMTIKLATSEDIPSVIDINTPTKIAAYEGDIKLTSGVSFSSSDTNIIEVNAANEITGKRAGNATITAKATGYKDATCDIKVRVTYDVTCTCTDVTLSNPKATTDKDYITTITVNKDKINDGNGYSVPDAIDVKVGVTSLTPDEEYTYTPTENTFSAELVIPKENIGGAIEIGLAVKELTPLCFTNLEKEERVNALVYFSCGVERSTINIQWSNDLSTWKNWGFIEDEPRSVYIQLKPGDKLYVRNTTNTLSTSVQNTIEFCTLFKCGLSGNINSLINYGHITNHCFRNLFRLCTDCLITAPALPATTLADNCYDSMFSQCYSLASAPALPATTLADNCYADLFFRCESITKMPTLSATTLKSHCYSRMFGNCVGLTEAYLPASDEDFNEVKFCYHNIFNGCSNLNYVKVGFGNKGKKDWPSNDSNNLTTTWLTDVANKGTFVWRGSEEGPETRNENTIPAGWTCISYE